MKKLLILTASLLAGGLVLPASADSRRHYQPQQTVVYISGYLPCGTPIYARRPVAHRGHDHYYRQQARIQREREIRRQREIQRQLEYRRQLERQRYLASLRHRGAYAPRCR